MIVEPTVRMLNLSQGTGELNDLMDVDDLDEDAVNSAVFAGRACYQSFGKTFAPTAKDSDYIESTVHGAQHYSIIEHASVAFYVTGVSRSLTHELVRHRQFGYSQLSQRYVDSKDLDWVCPPEYLDQHEEQDLVRDQFHRAVDVYDTLVRLRSEALRSGGEMISATEVRKRARQSARSVLPNCTETRLVISGNHRAWLEAMGKRWAGGAEVEIRRLFGKHILPRLREVASDIYSHVPDDYRLTGLPTLDDRRLVWHKGALYRVEDDNRLVMARAGEVNAWLGRT